MKNVGWPLLIGFLLTGCGGTSVSTLSTSRAPGSANIVVTWPKSTRVIPGDAQSIEVLLTPVTSGLNAPTVTLTNGTDYISRPVSGNISNVTTVQLAPGTYTVAAKAWPGSTPTSGGAVSALGSTNLVISAGQTSDFTVTMASTIDHLEVTAGATTVEVDTTGKVSPGGGGSSTVLPLIPSLLNPISIVPKDVSGANLVLFPATLTGGEISNPDGKLLVGGQTSVLDNVAGSTLTANLAANADATNGFDSNVVVQYSEAGSTLNSFVIPCHSSPIVFGGLHATKYGNLWSQITSASTIDGAHTLFVGNFDGTESIGNDLNSGGQFDLYEVASDLVATSTSTDGYYLSASGSVHNFGAASAGPPNGLANVIHLVSNLGKTGAPFVLDSTGIYEVGIGAPVTSSRLSTSLQTAVGAALDNSYTYWSEEMSSTFTLARTDKNGVDTNVAVSLSTLKFPIAADVKSPLIYRAFDPGTGAVVEAISPSGTVIGSLNLNISIPVALAIFVNGTTGEIDGTAFDSSSDFSDSQWFYGATGNGGGTIG